MKKIILAAGIFLLLAAGCSSKNTASADVGQQNSAPVTNKAIIHTDLGNIEIKLHGDQAPKNVANFSDLAVKGFYNGQKVHYILRDKMFQLGDPNSKNSNRSLWGFGGPGYAINDEINSLKLTRGAVAMVSGGPNTNGSRFLIVTAESLADLDGKNTVFGTVTKGFDILDLINQTPTDQFSRPTREVLIQKITVE